MNELDYAVTIAQKKNGGHFSGRVMQPCVHTQYALRATPDVICGTLCYTCVMAIEFARVRYIKRSDGGNVCRSAAYNDRSDVKCNRTGERFYFAHRDPVLYKNVLLPQGADEKFLNPETLWNEAQAMERRKDSQEARELLLALPTDVGLTLDDWKVMAEEFAKENFVNKGLGVQLDIHMPHKGEVNVHAHMLITTRRIEGGRFSDKKARDLDPEIKTMKGGQKAVTEGERWGILWRDYQNLYFEREGLDIRVDDVGPYAQRHEGPVRLRTRPKDAEARAEATREANEKAAHDPERILDTLMRRRATFTELDVERLIHKHVADPVERAQIRAAVLANENVVSLHNRESGAFTGRYTTKDVREQERAVMRDADAIATNRKPVKERASQSVAKERTLDPEQVQAFAKATGTDGLVVIEGLAGTGKSHSLVAIKEAHERAGWHVVGLSPTNTAAEGLRRSGFERASTVHLELFWQENKRRDRAAPWDRRTALIVDEAAMLDTRTYARLMRHAAETGAKVILAGDDRQLSSVERGGMFTALKERHGSVVISKVRRQEKDWQKEASQDFADGRVAEGLRAYAEHGHVHWSKDIDESRARLLSDWDQDSREDTKANRFVYAGTNAEVDELNRRIQEIRAKRGDIKGELEADTVRGKLVVGTGDRIQFHGNDRKAGIYNGALATVEKIKNREITALTDTGRQVKFDTEKFKEFGLGYAGTVYRGQGKTQTEVYALYDNVFAWNARTAYVGLTRHSDRVELYVSRDLARDEPELAKRMGKRFHEEASLAWATPEEVQMKKAKDKGRDKEKMAEKEKLTFAKDRIKAAELSKEQERGKEGSDKGGLTFAKDRDKPNDRKKEPGKERSDENALTFAKDRGRGDGRER
ncbi:MAG: AAA family ATPase [Alphaproteobacteria bacterium]|nr:AAA family ATPase [Alphaproteobacteria bacterium]